MALPEFTFDINGQLKDDGAVAASAVWQVSGADKIFDTSPGAGDAAGWLSFAVDLAVTALEIDTGDELYRLIVQGSEKADFADTIVNLAELRLGPAAALDGDVDSVVGRYVINGHNDVGGTVYRYMRGRTIITGTIASGGIDFRAGIFDMSV